MAETDHHRILMTDTIEVIGRWFGSDPFVYVSGNLLIHYEEGNRRRHVSPDVFVVKGVPRGRRPNYLVWEEGRRPDLVIEFTSRTTRTEDQETKLDLYRDTLQVREYFLFDPFEEYLFPSMQGFRLVGGKYQTLRPKDGRLPSRVLGLHLERDGERLRFWNPDSRVWLRHLSERLSQSDAEVERLRKRVEELERRLGDTAD